MSLDTQVKQYIINCITEEDYDNKPLVTDKDKLQFLADTFKSEYGWSIERYGAYKAFREWMMGLPSSFTIEFRNYDILQLAKTWGSLPGNATEKQEDRILDNYWNFIANKTFQLFRKHKITV